MLEFDRQYSLQFKVCDLRCVKLDTIMGIFDMNELVHTTPRPPYYVVIFSSQLQEEHEGYMDMVVSMRDYAVNEAGCLGIEALRDRSGFGITVSYWSDLESVEKWKQHAKHKSAQKIGMKNWYDHYHLRVARVERDYAGPEGRLID